jgi:DNA-binding transcriptional MerR regulator
MKKIRIQEVKQALRDPEFRKKLPPELKTDVQKYEQNPGCPCNLPIYMSILKKAAKQLMEYYPNQEVENPDEELMKLAENHFSVINCHIDELEKKLKSLPSGRKQIAVARYEDQVTVIVNELDILI